MRVQRTRSSASPPHSPLTRRPLGSCASEWCQEFGLQVRGLSGWRSNLSSTGVMPRVEVGRASSAQRLQVYRARFDAYAA